ncbi:MAG: TolC family protein [Bacteroidetes bacterium]|nr:MAG: TolC family protein [Bacteroidota bacterium]
MQKYHKTVKIYIFRAIFGVSLTTTLFASMRVLLRLSFGLFLGLASQCLRAQSTILDNYISVALQNNLVLKQEDFSIQKAMLALDEAKGLYLPQASFQATYTLAGGGRKIAFPIGDLLNPVYLTLNQLTASNRFPQIENVSEQFLPNNFHETYLQVVQPIFNKDIYYNLQIKKSLIEVQKAQKDVYAFELKRNVKQAYLQYLQLIQIRKIYARTETLLKEVLRTNQKLVANDKATSEIIFGTEYEIKKLESEMAELEKNRQVAQAYFNFLLNQPVETAIVADTLLNLQPAFELSLPEAENKALASRPEFQQLKQAQNTTSLSLNMQKGNQYPRINLAGQAGFQGFRYTFDNNQDYWLVRVSLQWDIFKGFQNKRKIEQIKIEQDKLSLRQEEIAQQIRLQIQRAYYEWRATEGIINANTSALTFAEKNYNLIRKKYEQGTARYIELIDAQTKLTQAQIALSVSRHSAFMKYTFLNDLL